MTLPATIDSMTGPGLAKTRTLPGVFARSGVFVSVSDSRWRELFEKADVISEGSAREEHGERTWYGSTSLLLSAQQGDEANILYALAEHDMHVRLRALRTARREAALRAPGRLGRLACEIRVSRQTQGVRVDVEVQAPLIERRAAARPAQ
jgi:hypothetical protein